MSDYLKVDGNAGLVRDMETKAILNINNSDYDNYLKQKNSVEVRKDLINKHTEEINNIKQDLNDIKQLLLEILKNDHLKGK